MPLSRTPPSPSPTQHPSITLPFLPLLLQEVLKAMIPTPLSKAGETASSHKGGRMGGAHTWFAYRHWYSTKNIGMEVRGAARLASSSRVGGWRASG